MLTRLRYAIFPTLALVLTWVVLGTALDQSTATCATVALLATVATSVCELNVAYAQHREREHSRSKERHLALMQLLEAMFEHTRRQQAGRTE